METKGILLRARSLFQSLRIPASGLTAQRQRLDVIAQNIANAETTRTAEGGPYRRQVASLTEVRSAPTFRLTPAPWEGEAESVDPTRDLEGVAVAGVSQDPSDLVPVYDPGHPDANEDGYVLYPNVELTAEMVDLMGARRVYEANLSVFQAVKSMLRQATQI